MMKRSAAAVWRWAGAISPGRMICKPAEQAVSDPLLPGQTGILEHHHAPLGFLGRDDPARLHEIGPHLLVAPYRRHARGDRLLRDHSAELGPERRQMLGGGTAIEILAPLLGLAIDGREHRVVCHGLSPFPVESAFPRDIDGVRDELRRPGRRGTRARRAPLRLPWRWRAGGGSATPRPAGNSTTRAAPRCPRDRIPDRAATTRRK